MWNTEHQSQKKNKTKISQTPLLSSNLYRDFIQIYRNLKGFSLIEVILVIGLCSIVMSGFYIILDFSTRASVWADEEDEIHLQGRYVVDYIKNEVKEADKIIATHKILNLDTKYPNNLGFVIFEDKGESYSPKDERYRFFTYYLNKDKLIRISTNKGTDTYPKASDLKGNNEMCDRVLSIEDSKLDFENKLLELRLSFGKDGKEDHIFKNTSYLNTKFDY